MPTWLTIILSIAACALAAFVIIYSIVTKKYKNTSKEQQRMMDETKETFTIFVIDKKKMALRDSGLPKAVLSEAPKRHLRKKMPMVKAKIGGRVFSLVADKDVFDRIPVKANVRAVVSGIFISDFMPLKASSAVDINAKKKK